MGGKCVKSSSEMTMPSYLDVMIGKSLQNTKVVNKALLLAKNSLALMVEGVNYVGQSVADKCRAAQVVVGAAAGAMIVTKIPNTALEFLTACKREVGKVTTGRSEEAKLEAPLSSEEEVLHKGSDFLADSMTLVNWTRHVFQFGKALNSLTLLGNCATIVKDSYDLFEASLSLYHARKIVELCGLSLKKNQLEDLARQENLCYIRAARTILHLGLTALAIVGIVYGWHLLLACELVFQSAYCIGCIWDVVYADMTKTIKESRGKTLAPQRTGLVVA